MSIRPEWTALRENVRIGATWLLRDEQPTDAMITHLGIGEHCGGGLYLTFAPGGRLAGNPSDGERHSVVVVELMTSDEQYRAGVEKPAPFTAEEIQSIRDLLVDAELDVVDQWNGAGAHTGSFAVAACAPSLAAAQQRYAAGCPKPGHSVFCGGGDLYHAVGATEEAKLDYANCSWWSDHRPRLIEPAFVAVPFSVPASSQSDDDRNLRAVKDALERITPILVEMGVHRGTLAAGARGHIEGDDDELAFVRDVGHGVLIPAEAALRLVALAARAIEVGLDEEAPMT